MGNMSYSVIFMPQTSRTKPMMATSLTHTALDALLLRSPQYVQSNQVPSEHVCLLAHRQVLDVHRPITHSS